jgi:hypothetical protein
MLLFLFLVAITVAGSIELVRKYVLHIKEPNADELLKRVEQKEWFQELLEDEDYKEKVNAQKANGLLADPQYLQKLLSHEGTVLGFISFIKKK